MEKKTYDFIRENIHLLDIDYEKGVINNRREYAGNRGYLTIGLNYRRISVHNIIAFLKYGEEAINLQVNHINGIKSDNTPKNLEVVTQSENTKHAFEVGLKKPLILNGERHGRSKLTKKDVTEIRELLRTEIPQKDIAEKFNVTKSTISDIKSGRRWGGVKS